MYNGQILTDFYSILSNGYAYVDIGSVYSHLVKDTPEAYKRFLTRRKNVTPNQGHEVDDYVPSFKNMYRVREKDSDWEYAVCDYIGATG